MSVRSDAEHLIASLVPYIERHGIRLIGSPSIAAAQPRKLEVCGLSILYLPKGGKLSKEPPPSLIDIREDGGGKVFSAWFNPVEIVRFKRGLWVNELLAHIASKEAQ